MVVLVTMFSVVVGLLALLVAGLLRSHALIVRALHELGADVGARPSTCWPAARIRTPSAMASLCLQASAARP